MSQPQKTKNLQSAQWSKKKLWSFRFILAALPFFFLVSLEFGLRLFGYGPDLSLFTTHSEIDGLLVGNQAVERRYFSQEGQTGFGTDDAFAKIKKPETLRIFVLGGSTTAGYP